MFSRTLPRILITLILLALAYFVVVHPRLRYLGRGRYPGAEHHRRESRREHRGREEWSERRPQESTPGAGRQAVCETQYFADWREPARDACKVRMRNGYPEPDPRCTPGGANPSLTLEVLRDPSWRTRSVRNCASSEAQKHIAYNWYGIQKPRINSNENQVCELDHLVPLELGGADGLGNIWPQCGPDAVSLNQRYFKKKDHVENYLADQVKAGRMQLSTAQKGIAADWTQYLPAAEAWCAAHGRC